MNEIEQKIIERCQLYQSELILSIQEILRIPSIKSSATDDAPYGKAIKDALDHTLRLSESLGFKSKNIENRVGFAQYGDQQHYVGIMGHLDVVEVNDGWCVPPFSGEIVDKKIISRGVLDNKGPLYTNLYAMKVIKEICEENHIKLNHAIRIIFGCDEESGFSDVPYYLNAETLPIYGYTPDCKYPPVYSERGRLQLSLSCLLDEMNIFFEFISTYFLSANNSGDRLGIAISQKEFGSLEMRGYQIKYEDNQIMFQFSISYPPVTTSEQIVRSIKDKISDKAIQLNVLKDWLPVYFDKDQSFIRMLSLTYEELTGLDGSPVTTTGGTYAKLVPNIIPFGPSFPGQKGIAHQPNEYWDLSDLVKNFEIYALSLYRLARLDLN